MNVEIQANQCREGKVRFFPVQDFSVQLAVLAKKLNKKDLILTLKSSFRHSLTTFPSSYFSS